MLACVQACLSAQVRFYLLSSVSVPLCPYQWCVALEVCVIEVQKRLQEPERQLHLCYDLLSNLIPLETPLSYPVVTTLLAPMGSLISPGSC